MVLRYTLNSNLVLIVIKNGCQILEYTKILQIQGIYKDTKQFTM